VQFAQILAAPPLAFRGGIRQNNQFQQFFSRIFCAILPLDFSRKCGIILLSDGDGSARQVEGCFGLSLHPAEGVQGGSIPPTSTKKYKKGEK
jgi:hypothetical protein